MCFFFSFLVDDNSNEQSFFLNQLHRSFPHTECMLRIIEQKTANKAENFLLKIMKVSNDIQIQTGRLQINEKIICLFVFIWLIKPALFVWALVYLFSNCTYYIFDGFEFEYYFCRQPASFAQTISLFIYI